MYLYGKPNQGADFRWFDENGQQREDFALWFARLVSNWQQALLNTGTWRSPAIFIFQRNVEGTDRQKNSLWMAYSTPLGLSGKMMVDYAGRPAPSVVVRQIPFWPDAETLDDWLEMRDEEGFDLMQRDRLEMTPPRGGQWDPAAASELILNAFYSTRRSQMLNMLLAYLPATLCLFLRRDRGPTILTAFWIIRI